VDIALFTDRTGVEKQFGGVKRGKGFTLKRFPTKHLKTEVRKLKNGSFVYLDIHGYEQDERVKILKYLSKLRQLRYGIIDTEGKVKDVASLFHQGAFDYIHRNVLKEGVSASRLKKAVQLRPVETEREGLSAPKVEGLSLIPSGRDWSSIRPGHEYTFGMMYIELDDQSILKNKLSDGQINAFMHSFKRYIERNVVVERGRIWIWNDYGGLVLFPFDGNRCDATVIGLRLMLSRRLFSVEETCLDMIFSYKIALHVGNTVYKKKGTTGTIVSTSINTIFHLGQKYLHPGQFYVTREAFAFSPAGLKDSFVQVGNYEGHDIFRMKLPE
jgi:hypothetical protein